MWPRRDFVPTDHLEAKRAKRFDRFAQFSVVGAQMALADANLDLSRENRERVGANMGTALGGVAYAESQLAVFLQRGLREVDAALALAVFGGASSCISPSSGCHGTKLAQRNELCIRHDRDGDAFRQIAMATPTS